MTPEQIQLMMTMAQSIDTMQKQILPLLEKMSTMPTGMPVTPASKYVQTVENNTDVDNFKMNVQIEGDDRMPIDVRRTQVAFLLRDMKKLLRDYKVIKLDGSYEFLSRIS